jgi:hypothetical protein
MKDHAVTPGAGWYPEAEKAEHAIEEKAFGFWMCSHFRSAFRDLRRHAA